MPWCQLTAENHAALVQLRRLKIRLCKVGDGLLRVLGGFNYANQNVVANPSWFVWPSIWPFVWPIGEPPPRIAQWAQATSDSVREIELAYLPAHRPRYLLNQMQAIQTV